MIPPLVAVAMLLGACTGELPDPANHADAGQDAPPVADAGAGDAGEDSPPAPDAGAGSHTPGWTIAWLEDFESVNLGNPAWVNDPVPDDGPFADRGAFFRAGGVVPPAAFRISQPFGQGGWLTLESYTRSSRTPFASLASVVQDPANPHNHALRIASPVHTDATVVRPTQALPGRYRVSLRIGFADFGNGLPGANGYDGGETAEPWSAADATRQNGFYWLTILDAMPRPHNNTWIHHHRKVVIDSDNHYPPWMRIFNGSDFVPSGEHPIMMFALDGRRAANELTGPPFLSWSAGAWQPSGAIRAVDAYLPGEWYQVSVERFDDRFTMEISGRFRHGGQTTYRATIDAAAECVWHFNRTVDAGTACSGTGHYPSLGPGFPYWPAGQSWPDWFMFGDPHSNYYEGNVLYDDVKLEVWN